MVHELDCAQRVTKHSLASLKARKQVGEVVGPQQAKGSGGGQGLTQDLTFCNYTLNRN